MSEELRWEEFDEMHVIKRLKELVGKWWQVQINFTDKSGLLRGVEKGKFFNPLNPIFKEITASERGFTDCRNDARKTTIDAMGAKGEKLFRCTSGFSALSVPIKVGKSYLGCVYGDGFIIAETAAEQKSLITNYLERVLPEKADSLKQQLSKLPVLSQKDIEYLTELVKLVVDEIIELHSSLSAQKKQIDELNGALNNRYGFHNMIGKSQSMQDLYRLMERVADSDSTILVQGENGTGKELIAKALHYNSKRKSNKFLVVNCGAFNENLLESELFGHIKGSFTGAHKDKKGVFEAADKGTLFLDEIGETSPSMQVKLLRVLQEGTFTPVGSTQVLKSNVRVLAATNRNLMQMVRDGSFREDLFYRLNVINVVVPPLRDRKDDIPILINHFLGKMSKGKGSIKISKSCMEKILNHDWPGNVRELENEIERLCVLADSNTEVFESLLSPRILESSASKFPGLRISGSLKDAIDELELQMIKDGLEKHNWNKSKLAKELGISRAGLIMKVEKYKLEKRKVS